MADDPRRQEIVEGITAFAVSCAMRKLDTASALSQIVGLVQQLGVDDVSVLEEAAAGVVDLPQPPEDPLEHRERLAAMRERTGIRSPEDDLTASLQAREWLQDLVSRARPAD